MITGRRTKAVLTFIAVAMASLVTITSPVSAALVLKLEAANYDPSTGAWSDTSGNSNHATQGTTTNRPGLVANQSANGSSVVRFDGAGDFLNLTSPISPASAADGFTAFAYLRPYTAASPRTIFSGTVGSLQYRVSGSGAQQLVRTYQANLGSGSVLSTSDFSNINAQVNNAGGSFRLNGAADGSATASSFTAPITNIGRNDQGNNEFFAGDIAEIRIYNTQLTLPQVQAVEAELNAAYVTPTGRVALPVILNSTFDANAHAFTASPGYVAPITPANPTEIANWPGTGSRGINPGNGAGAPFRNNGNNASQVAFIQGPGSISQAVSGWEVGKEYRVAFDYNSRSGYAAPGMSAAIGSASLTDASIPAVGGSNSYYAGNLVFTAANATETLMITSLNNAGDDTLLVDNFRVFRNGPAIANNGFEAPVFGNNQFKYQFQMTSGELAAAVWLMSGSAGITHNFSGFQNGNIPAPEGDQHAFMQGDSPSFVQTISGFEVGADYTLSLLTMARQAGAGGNDLEVVLDAGLASEIVLLDIPEVTFSGFTELESSSFLAAKDSYELTIRASLDGGTLTGDRTTFFDNLWFNQLTEAFIIPEPSSLAIWGLGLLGLIGWRRRK